MENKRKKIEKRVSEIVEAATNSLPTEGHGKIQSDVLGSYTGTPEMDEVPEQDPDDL